jgi:hypothetical protein
MKDNVLEIFRKISSSSKYKSDPHRAARLAASIAACIEETDAQEIVRIYFEKNGGGEVIISEHILKSCAAMNGAELGCIKVSILVRMFQTLSKSGIYKGDDVAAARTAATLLAWYLEQDESKKSDILRGDKDVMRDFRTDVSNLLCDSEASDLVSGSLLNGAREFYEILIRKIDLPMEKVQAKKVLPDGLEVVRDLFDNRDKRTPSEIKRDIEIGAGLYALRYCGE